MDLCIGRFGTNGVSEVRHLQPSSRRVAGLRLGAIFLREPLESTSWRQNDNVGGQSGYSALTICQSKLRATSGEALSATECGSPELQVARYDRALDH